MTRLVAVMAVLFAAGCSGAQKPSVADARTFSGDAREAPVGGRMVDARSTAVRVDPTTGRSQVSGVHAEFTYLGFMGGEGGGKSTIRVRYEERKIKDGVESDAPDLRAEVRLDLALGNVISYRGWSIGVVEATDAGIKFVAVQVPPVP